MSSNCPTTHDLRPANGPGRILDLSWGLARTATLVTGLDLDVFTHVAHGCCRPAQIAAAEGASGAHVAALMTALVAIGLLETDDDGAFRLADDAATYLVRGEPRYLGDLRHLHHSLNFRLWPELTGVVRSGRPPRDLFGAGDSEQTWHQVLPYLDALGAPAAAWIAQVVAERLPAGPRVLDLGCGSGIYGRVLAQRLPGCQVVGIDRPELVELASQTARTANLDQRVRYRGGDLRQLSWDGEYDLVLLSNVLHGYSAEECRTLLRRARDALRTGGLIVIHEFLPDPEQPETNTVAALFALEIALTSGGAAHDEAQYRSWLHDLGLGTEPAQRAVSGPTSVILAYPSFSPAASATPGPMDHPVTGRHG